MDENRNPTHGLQPRPSPSPYEAHVEKADGSVVTVKIDGDFNVTDTITGFGHGPLQPTTSN